MDEVQCQVEQTRTKDQINKNCHDAVAAAKDDTSINKIT